MAVLQQRFAIADTGLEVSPLGLGTVKLGRDKGVKYPESFTIPDDRAAAELIALAAELGINLIDTAPAYGRSEVRLGELLKGQRQRWIICSKVGEEFEGGESHFDFTAEHTRFSIERSLKRLNTDYLDMVLIHSNGDDLHVLNQGVVEELQRCQQAGLIRAIGASTKTVEGGLAAAERMDAVMITHNLAYREEQAVIDFCRDNGKAVLVKKAFASGHLQADIDDPIQASMDFLFADQGISSAIVGTINPAHLRHNVAAAASALSKSG